MAEKCSSCDQMKKENSTLRKSLMETNKYYVEVINENLELRRKITKLTNPNACQCQFGNCTLCRVPKPDISIGTREGE